LPDDGHLAAAARLKRRDREVIRPGQLTADECRSIADAEVPLEYASFDSELKSVAP
jgi:hypothetical protein